MLEIFGGWVGLVGVGCWPLWHEFLPKIECILGGQPFWFCFLRKPPGAAVLPGVGHVPTACVSTVPAAAEFPVLTVCECPSGSHLRCLLLLPGQRSEKQLGDKKSWTSRRTRRTRKHSSGLGSGMTGRTPTLGAMATGRTWASPPGDGAGGQPSPTWASASAPPRRQRRRICLTLNKVSSNYECVRTLVLALSCSSWCILIS